MLPVLKKHRFLTDGPKKPTDDILMWFLPDQLYDDHYDRHGQIPICYRVIYTVTLCIAFWLNILQVCPHISLNFRLQHASKGWPGFALCWVNLDHLPWARKSLSEKSCLLSSLCQGFVHVWGYVLRIISKSGISGSWIWTFLGSTGCQVTSFRKVIPVFTATNRVCRALHLENMFALCCAASSFSHFIFPPYGL